MPGDLEHTVPAATAPLPAGDAETYLVQVKRWLEGYVDDQNKQHPGLFAMVTELYEEAKNRRERREAFLRAVASGSALAVFGLGATWIKDHWR